MPGRRSKLARIAGGATAMQTYTKSRCNICHSLNAKGGRVGPALDDAGKRWTGDKLFAFLKSPTSVNPRSSMPPMRATDEEIHLVADYLATLGGTPKVVEPEPSMSPYESQALLNYLKTLRK